MNFAELVEIAADLHCFSPGMVTAGRNIEHVRVQLSRWVTAGRIIRIHKGWYTLNQPFRRVRLDTNVIASNIKPGSYVSTQRALAFHGMIPEHVTETTCVTTARPQTIQSPVGRIGYRHIKRDVFFGYTTHERGIQNAYIAVPEKALLDLLYLTAGSDNRGYIQELRLQQTERLDLVTMAQMAGRFRAPRLERAVKILGRLIRQDNGGHSFQIES